MSIYFLWPKCYLTKVYNTGGFVVPDNNILLWNGFYYVGVYNGLRLFRIEPSEPIYMNVSASSTTIHSRLLKNNYFLSINPNSRLYVLTRTSTPFYIILAYSFMDLPKFSPSHLSLEKWLNDFATFLVCSASYLFNVSTSARGRRDCVSITPC